MMMRPMCSATCGTTALPKPLSLSIRLGIPLAIRPTLGSDAQFDPRVLGMSALVRCAGLLRGWHFLSLNGLSVWAIGEDQDCVVALMVPFGWLSLLVSIPSFRVAITNTRSRRCGAPTAAAGMQSHCVLYPSAARSAWVAPNPNERWPVTFSSNANRGRSMRMQSAKRGQRCRGSFVPFLAPA